jgi:hypothetical protein
MLLSRMYHESVADVVVRAINDLFSSEHGGLLEYVSGEELQRDVFKLLWDEREHVRLAKLAFHYPTLLSGAEKRLWQEIVANDVFWAARPQQEEAQAQGGRDIGLRAAGRKESYLLADVLAVHWDRLIAEQG